MANSPSGVLTAGAPRAGAARACPALPGRAGIGHRARAGSGQGPALRHSCVFLSQKVGFQTHIITLHISHTTIIDLTR
eukprot:6780268-Prymnesium_polylepis.3